MDQGFGYDELERLKQVTLAGGSWGFDYDANGNRTVSTVNGSTSDLTISANSNRITSITNPTRNFVYDNTGNTTADGLFSATYDLTGRMNTLTKSGVTTNYTYDSLGRRIRKYSSTGAASTVVFFYDQQGQLLGEYDNTGKAIREYVWLGSTPVAVFTPDPVDAANPPIAYFIHTDHIDTPRVVMDKNNAVRWKWLSEPFGVDVPDTNPSGLGALTLNMRFPGQYFDQESGLHYNYFRSYDSSIGRYTTSDPIGLEGGINTYAYVGGNPLSFVDPFGLAACTYSISAHTLVCSPDDGGDAVSLGPTGVWSGVGSCANDASCVDDKNDGPIVPGTYNMNPDNRPRHETFWRLEPNPQIPGWKCKTGLERCGFMLHPGSVSLGCITADKKNAAAMDQYKKIHDLLNRERISYPNRLTVIP